MLKNLGVPELFIILALVVLFWGGKKIPEFMRGIGQAIKEYRDGAADKKEESPK